MRSNAVWARRVSTAPWPIIVFSHLRWDFVYQRPQQILSRLAPRRQVLFVEEPMQASSPLRVEVTFPVRNVMRCVPMGAGTERTLDARQVAKLTPLLHSLLRGVGHHRHMAWLYSPMALPLALALEPASIVYDCMDELSAFDGAPPTMIARETELFGVADVVFTGGPSLFRAKRERHPRVHCFPSSVDAEHFRKAGPARAAGRSPRLGFYGVLDERLDRDLVAAVAARRPNWHFDLVGPVVKIDPSLLPRAANIHYPGSRSYQALPSLVAEWDVCLLPFALNAATRFISPTKVLEYMAAERPIVSTPITDVAEPYADVVRIARSPDEFVAACTAALEEGPVERQGRTARMREIVAATSWDDTVARMSGIIDALALSKGESPWPDTTRSSSAPALPA